MDHDEVGPAIRRYFTDAEVADLFGVSRRTVLRWRNNGKISFLQLEAKALFRPRDVYEFLKRLEQPRKRGRGRPRKTS